MLYHADVWQVAVFLVIIEAIAYNELIRDRKAGVINFYLFLYAALRLVKQSA